MPAAKLFINNVHRDLLKAHVPREACRSLDQGRFELPATTDVCPSDCITYVQDMVDLGSNRLLFNFCQHPKDESGYAHHLIGHCTFPSSLSHWCFQTNLVDSGLAANDLIVNCGCATFTCGKVSNTCGTAKSFDFACGRFVAAPNECDYDLQNNNKITLATWIYPGAGCGTEFVMGKRAGLTACDAGFSIEHNKTCNNATFTLGNGTTQFIVASVMCTIAACMWTHVVATYDAQLNQDGMKIYINGELNATGTCTTITGSILNNVAFSIGANIGGSNNYTGRADDVRIFADKELSLCQVTSLYQDGSVSYPTGQWEGLAIRFDGDKGHGIVPDAAPADPRPRCLVAQFKFECDVTDSAGCNDGTVTGCTTFVGGLIDCNAFDFNDSTRIALANERNFDFDIMCKFSFSYWMKGDNTTVDCFPMVVSKRVNIFATSTGWSSIWNRSLNRSVFEVGNGTTRFSVTTPNCSITDCMWTHIVGTYDGTSCRNGLRLYIDGEISSTGCVLAITGSILNNCAVTIGGGSAGARDYKGQLDCVRIWKTELAPKEVRRLYQSTYSPLNGPYEYITWLKVPNPKPCPVTVFHKSTACSDGVELSVLGTTALGPGFSCTGFTSTGFITAGSGAMCTVTWRHGGITLSGTSDVVDTCFHQIRVTRDACNLVSLYVDNVKEDCATITCDPTTTANLEFSRDFSGGQVFCGDLSSFRFYHGNLDSIETCALWSKRNPRTNVKFGGNSTKITKSIAKKKLITQSFSKQLGEIEVRATTFNCRTPEFILETLIKCNTDLDTHFHGIPAGITLQVYQADGKLVDIANDLSQLTGKVYHVDGLKQFHLHDSLFNLTTATFQHGVAMSNIDSATDDVEIVNDLLIIGSNKRYTTSEEFTGDCVETVFCLTQGPVTARVEHPILTELCPEVDYEVCPINKTLTFTTAPDMCGGADNILIEYEYELPLNIRGTKQSSIDEFGRKAKRLVLPWIQNRQDGTRFISAYLNNFQDVTNRFEVTIPGLANGIDVHDVITIINPIKGVNGTFIIKSITWDYPKGTTLLHVGEFNFGQLEFAKQITEKIHDLESAVTTSKDLRDFESPEEILALIDTVGINVDIQASPQSLGITVCGAVEEVFAATYTTADYGADDVYTGTS